MKHLQAVAPQIVHEAIDERQHVRVKLPAQLLLDVRDTQVLCQIEDLSLGGISLTCPKELTQNKMYNAHLSLVVKTFTLKLDITLKVTSQRDRTFGLVFVDLEKDKQDVLRFLINSYLSGEIAEIDGVFNVLQRENHIKERKKSFVAKRSIAERIQAIAGSGLYLLAGLGILSVLLYKCYLFFFRVEAVNAVVQADSFEISMPENGQVRFLIEKGATEVRTGQPIASVSTQLMANFNSPADLQALANLSQADLQTVLGKSLIETVITSPCDCLVYFPNKTTDRYAYKTEALMHLIPKNQPMEVEASLPFNKLNETASIERVVIRIYGQEDAVTGTVVDSALDAENNLLKLKIQPATALPASFYLKPAAVEFYKRVPFFSALIEG
ncbi:MAG: PilZ domain-containing protein [Hahellaceae bacterium]|nr:PilZ domain-containing protein [Hahellaceae bacterium]MCP5169114.1 PilZ domain-containing protein [Hahellaceae bacterium]